MRLTKPAQRLFFVNSDLDLAFMIGASRDDI